jgi:[acyl-carrier-protein] S-malonyltransferase
MSLLGRGDPRIAFVFPGQGAQRVGMGAELFTQTEAGRDLLQRADRFLDLELSRLILEGPQEELNLTCHAQPAILLLSVALADLLQVPCVTMAGHSLGEYSALVVSGALRLGQALRLVHQRGLLMQQAVPPGDGAMAAVMGVAEEDVRAAVAATQDPNVVIANYNCPGQLVISGYAAAVDAALARLPGARVVRLPVSGPFHSPLMRPAEEGLAPLLEETEFQDASVPIYGNVDGAPAWRADELRNKLSRQVSRPVLWEESVRRMIQEQGVNLFIEIGPGRTLTQFLRRIDPSVKGVALNAPADVEKIERLLH